MCCATTRIYVANSILKEFIKQLVDVTSNGKVGDPFAEDTFQGPQISKVQFDKIMNFIDVGKKEGANYISCGTKEASTAGYFIQPVSCLNLCCH